MARQSHSRDGSLTRATAVLPLPAEDSPATLRIIQRIACGRAGELYVVEGGSRTVLRIEADGSNAALLWRGDPVDVAVDAAGSLLILDAAGTVLRIDNAGTPNVVAGASRFAGDGGYFIADTGNNRIRKVSASGVIQTVAGTGVYGFSGDGATATEAMVAAPDLLAVDRAGNLYFAGLSDLRVRKLSPDGVLETVAGSGAYGNSGDEGRASDATFRSIGGLAVDRTGRLYISDTVSGVVRVVASGIIS